MSKVLMTFLRGKIIIWKRGYVSPFCKSQNAVGTRLGNGAVMFYHLVAKRINQVKLS